MKRLVASIGDGYDRVVEALRFIATLPGFRDSPNEIEIDGAKSADVSNWQERILAAIKVAIVRWPRPDPNELARVINFEPRIGAAPLSFQSPDALQSFAELLPLLDAMPFDACVVGWLEDSAFIEARGRLVGVPMMGSGHTSLGSACAFRGNGHHNLVSRRWIDAGPWRVIRRPGDLTILQFYAPGVDPRTAVRQARPGWKRLAGVDGGVLSSPYQFVTTVDGLYDNNLHKLEHVVPPGEQIQPRLMNDYCAVRTRHHIVPPARADRPIDQVAFVFVDEAQARAHLDEMWLRELEVWVADGGGKRRLDDSYQPPLRSAPDWVAALGAAS